MKQKQINWGQIKKYVEKIVKEVKYRNFQPNLILCVGRGGMVASTLISHELGIPIAVLMITRYVGDGDGREIQSNEHVAFTRKFNPSDRILVVDDVIDNGYTINYTEKFLMRRLPHNRVMFCCLILKTHANFVPDIFGTTVPKETWVKFAWEK